MSEVVGVGLDLVDVERFRQVLERRPSLASRIFHPRELEIDRPERLAARFAAKEAFLKSLDSGLGAARLRDIEVVRAESGAPTLVLHGTAATLAATRGVKSWKLSLSHTDLSAGAIVVALA
jgi:holo-[acyl-carrier protein] synthase